MRDSIKGMIAAGLAIALALVLWWQNRPVEAPAPEPVAETAPETVTAAAEAPAPAPQPESAAAAPETVPAAAPQFDVVRITPEGQAVVAGHAAPGQEVEVVLDGVVIGKAVADAQGEFAAVLDMAPSSEPRELVLRTALSGEAGEKIALAPQVPAAPTEAASGESSAPQPQAEPAVSGLTAEETAAAAAKAAAEAERLAAEKAEAARIAAEKAEAERFAAEKALAGKLAAEKAEAERLAAEKTASDPVAAATGEEDPLAAEKAEAERIAAEKAEAERVAATEAASKAAGPAATSAEPQVRQFTTSAPVIILPQADADSAPLLVKPEKDSVTLLQPAQAEPGSGIALDRITYTDQGDLVAAGRGAANTLIRIYANAVLKAEVVPGANGLWQAQIDADIAEATQLLRFDAIDANGKVISRLEAPFEYSPLASVQEVRQRKIVVQRGDYLWKFAEQYYGKGIRYSVIFSANSNLIRDPDLIYPGQVFTVPELVTSQ